MTDSGDVTVQVASEETIVTDGSGTNTFKSYATRVGEGVYFVSWDGEHGGNHVVFNSNTSKAYDQIDNVKVERREMIYDVSCFADVGSC